MKITPLAGLLAVLGGVTLFYLWRDAAAIGGQIPLDPNEGWNAYHALHAWTHALYPPPGSLTFNNYPPLSFYIVGALTRLTGDAIIAGRLVSLAAFLVSVCAITVAAFRMGMRREGALFAAIFFALTLLTTSDYVAMDDPQLLGHAVQLCALCLVLRPDRPGAAGLLFVASLFIKHNLIALPLATLLFLWRFDRPSAWRLLWTGMIAALLGMTAFRLAYGRDLLTLIASPRLYVLANFENVFAPWLAWAGLPLLLVIVFLARAWRQKMAGFLLVYLALACIIGALFAPGDGVDANILFDADIALALAGGWMVSTLERRTTLLALAYVSPLLFFAAFQFEDGNFSYMPAFRAEAARDIAFLRNRPGPAICEMPSLCYWAGKPFSVDVFNLGETFRTDARNDEVLAQALEDHRFAIVQLSSPDTLGPRVAHALNSAYRVDHAGDNGIFFVPR